MKKILAGLILAIMAVAFLAPVAIAQEPVPAEITKCTMRHNLTDPAGCVPGSLADPCPWKEKGFICPWGASAAEKVCAFENPATPALGWDNTCGICCIMDTIYTVTDWIFLGVVSIAMIMIFIGAFNIVTAGGSPEKVSTGRSYIIFAAVGIIVALIAKLIPVIAKNIIGLG
ncbi:MAG: hypothetical protein ABH813_01245 [Patescibacteria group bacterium]